MAPRDPATVDTALARSVSFAPPETPARDPRLTKARPLVPVGPGRTAIVAPPPDAKAQVEVNGFPVQAAKVQPPPVRDETLRRDRLLDWLHAKVHSRVVLLIAEAGYGKTTLLADFSRRTRLRTLWYRLDETDGDWVSFVGHLVASARAHDPAFGELTYGLLGEVAAGAATRDAVLTAFVRDLHGLGDAGAALVLDDYHLVDGSPDVRQVLREILARGPDRLSLVISSRRSPILPLARIRAQGEVAELSVDDLRFDPSETDRLFRESYGRQLDRDVLEELHRRTEGWAASLHLVHAAVRDRSTPEIRAFVQRLSGAEGHLYDYLAEEVLGGLPAETQAFLMRTSILQRIEPELASLVTGLTRQECRAQIEFVERIGLLGRRLDTSRAALGYHPLVRDVLLDRLRRESGEAAGEALHRQVAVFAETRDWHLACHHYAAAGDHDGVRRVIDAALPAVMGSGAFLAAVPYLDRPDPPINTAPAEVIRSRVALANGDADGAVGHARRALDLDPASSWALANLASIHHTAGRAEDAADTVRLLRTSAADPDLERIGQTTFALLQGPDRPIGPTIRHLRQFAKEQLERGRLHYAGIAYLNAATLARVGGDASAALSDATSSITALEMSSNGAEVSAARMAKAWSLAHIGSLLDAREQIELALATPNEYQRNESHIEAAMIEAWYGSAERSRAHIAIGTDTVGSSRDRRRALALARIQLSLRTGETDIAERAAAGLDVAGTSAWPDQLVQYRSLVAHLAVARGRDPSFDLARAKKLARHQEAAFWVRYLAVLEGTRGGATDLTNTVLRMLVQDAAYLSILAELVAPWIGDLESGQLADLALEVELRPERWRGALRTALLEEGRRRSVETARLLAAVGTSEDILRLRRASRDPEIGRTAITLSRTLARRLAPAVYVEDQLRVTLRVGEREITGSQIRRKVLALLCYLLSRPTFSATRDQVLDALWPDLDPEVAVNSLNQTVYFLRRVFESDYREDSSPGYIHHESDVVWLDGELVRSRSADSAKAVIRATENLTPERVDALSETYKGRFALDFAYEDWAVPYRDSLHASYLQVIEAAVRTDIATGHYDRAIKLARRALEVDPEAEQLEVTLLTLYRLTGAHAAAAEQYEHYAAVQRTELGVEPPPLDTF